MFKSTYHAILHNTVDLLLGIVYAKPGMFLVATSSFDENLETIEIVTRRTKGVCGNDAYSLGVATRVFSIHTALHKNKSALYAIERSMAFGSDILMQCRGRRNR